MEGFYRAPWGECPMTADEALRATPLRMVERDCEKKGLDSKS